MSHVGNCKQAVKRLRRREKLQWMFLSGKQLVDEQVSEMLDCLLAHPNGVVSLLLYNNRLTDVTGLKLARLVASSDAIEELGLSHNQFSEATFLALAWALRTNRSLRVLFIYRNQPVDQSRVDDAFAHALRVNPHRPAQSEWTLYKARPPGDDYARLLLRAGALAHPTLLSLLMALDVQPAQLPHDDDGESKQHCLQM